MHTAPTFTKTDELIQAVQRRETDTWAIGDLLVEGSPMDGARFVPGTLQDLSKTIAETTGFTYSTSYLEAVRATAYAFPVRPWVVTFTHYVKAGTLPEGSRSEALARAERENLTVDQMLVEAGRAPAHRPQSAKIADFTPAQVAEVVRAHPEEAADAMSQSIEAQTAYHQAAQQQSSKLRDKVKDSRRRAEARQRKENPSTARALASMDIRTARELARKARNIATKVKGHSEHGTISEPMIDELAATARMLSEAHTDVQTALIRTRTR